jgi:hypothetical protein
VARRMLEDLAQRVPLVVTEVRCPRWHPSSCPLRHERSCE